MTSINHDINEFKEFIKEHQQLLRFLKERTLESGRCFKRSTFLPDFFMIFANSATRETWEIWEKYA
jgi:hypothetical protein